MFKDQHRKGDLDSKDSKFVNTSPEIILILNKYVNIRLFRSARASCATSGQPARGPGRAKNLDTYIQAYMPHKSSGDSSNQPIGHMRSPRRLP